MSERRRDTRHLACFPIHISRQAPLGGDAPAGDAEPATALIRDLSMEGAQILTQQEFAIGAELSLVLYLEDPERGHEVRGSVVRSEPREDGGIWPHLVALKFDGRLVGLEGQVLALAERQRRAGL